MTDFCSNQLTLQWNQLKNAGCQALSDGDSARAEQLFSEALTCARRLGEHDPRVVQSLNNLAAACSAQNKWEPAEHQYREALSILKQSQWHEHPDNAAVYLNLGTLYYTQGRLDEALVNIRRSYDLREFMYGPTHASLTKPLLLIGQIFATQHKWEPSLEAIVRARSLGEQHEDSLTEDEQHILSSTHKLIIEHIQEQHNS